MVKSSNYTALQYEIFSYFLKLAFFGETCFQTNSLLYHANTDLKTVFTISEQLSVEVTTHGTNDTSSEENKISWRQNAVSKRRRAGNDTQ